MRTISFTEVLHIRSYISVAWSTWTLKPSENERFRNLWNHGIVPEKRAPILWGIVDRPRRFTRRSLPPKIYSVFGIQPRVNLPAVTMPEIKQRGMSFRNAQRCGIGLRQRVGCGFGETSHRNIFDDPASVQHKDAIRQLTQRG